MAVNSHMVLCGSMRRICAARGAILSYAICGFAWLRYLARGFSGGTRFISTNCSKLSAMRARSCVGRYVAIATWLSRCSLFVYCWIGKDRRARSGEAVRNAAPEESRALSFRRYLELMTVLEEQFSGTKQLHSHKLFHRSNTHAFQPRELPCRLLLLLCGELAVVNILRSGCYPISLQEVDPRLVPDPTEQYDNRGINVPHKVSKVRIRSAAGYR